MTESPFLHLPLTPVSDTQKRFIDFREEVAGDDEDSAFVVLDAVIEDLNNRADAVQSGDMKAEDYDADEAVKNAGGIVGYVSSVSVPQETDLTITLHAAGWSGNGPYLQAVTIPNVTITRNTKVDLQAGDATLQQMLTDGTLAIYIANNNGTLVACAMSAAPQTALTVQVSLQEVDFDGSILIGRAIAVGLTSGGSHSSGGADVENNMLVINGATVSSGYIILDGSGVTVENGRLVFNGGGETIVLDSIYISTPPNKTEYEAGETFDATGMVVRARYAIDSTIVADREISGYAYSGVLTVGQTGVVIAYSENGVTKTTEQPVTVTGETGYVEFSSSNGSKFDLEIGETQTGDNPWEGTLEYSTDLVTWTEVNASSSIESSEDGKIYIRGSGNSRITGIEDPTVYDGSWSFYTNTPDVTIDCSGNIETLLDYETVLEGEHPDMSNNTFSYMFKDCENLATAPTLPAETLTESCYEGMFSGCTNLEEAPTLASTELADSCYKDMFSGCESLTATPELPAETLAASCYEGMFSNCTSLTTTTELPAETLATSCYESMFSGCENLTTAPELPAETLATACYEEMFSGCVSLEEAPTLPASTLAEDCYSDMFEGCTNVANISDLPTVLDSIYISSPPYKTEYFDEFEFDPTGMVVMASYSKCGLSPQDTEILKYIYSSNLQVGQTRVEISYKWDGIIKATYQPVVVAEDGGNQCLTIISDKLFGCGIDELFNGKMYYYNGSEWIQCVKDTTYNAVKSKKNPSVYQLKMYGVNNTCLSYKYNGEYYSGLNYWTLGGDLYCEGNVEYLLDKDTVDSGDHPQMSIYAFCDLFSGLSIVVAPELPATSLAEHCYEKMFAQCQKLIAAPNLPATQLSDYCYSYMFYECNSLTTPPTLDATRLGVGCYQGMFYGCVNLATAPELSSTSLQQRCYEEMFYDCESLITPPNLPATALAFACYRSMFESCGSLTKTPLFGATTVYISSCEFMFRGCESLTTATVPSATRLAESCYTGMFRDCVSLRTPPVLPATEMGKYCYSGMFLGCSSLETAPALPATTLAQGCYDKMFYNCSKLTTLPRLPATYWPLYCYRDMFSGCSSIKISLTQNDEYANEYRLPSSGSGTFEAPGGETSRMFAGTGGSYTSDPVVNTTYYTSNAIIGA